jgi:hypothetical protein
MTFEELVAEIRQDAPPGSVTVVSYEGIKFARDAGIDCLALGGSLVLSACDSRLRLSRGAAASSRHEGGVSVVRVRLLKNSHAESYTNRT